MFAQEFEKVAAPRDKKANPAAKGKMKPESKQGYSILENAMKILMEDDARKNMLAEQGATEKSLEQSKEQQAEAQAEEAGQLQNQAAGEAQQVDAQQASQKPEKKESNPKPKDKKDAAPPAAGGANVHVHVNGGGEDKGGKYKGKEKKK